MAALPRLRQYPLIQALSTLLFLFNSGFIAIASSSAEEESCNAEFGDCSDPNAIANNESNQCMLYLAESTIPHAGLGVFAGVFFKKDQLIGRDYGDAAFPTSDQDWHYSPADGYISRHEGDYHWPLTNYDWNAPDIGMENEAEDVSATVTGFGAAPNCHFRLLNVLEHEAEYDTTGFDRYSSPGAGASTPFFNRTTTANQDIRAGSEIFVDYGPQWFYTRPDLFALVPVSESYEKAQAFLWEYGKLLVGNYGKDDDSITGWENDLVQDKLTLTDEAQRDLWDIVTTFPYPTRAREALPDFHKDAIRAIHGDIQSVEIENSIRSLEHLKEHGKCMDNIVPGRSTIRDAGRGAFATRFIPKGGLVAPAPVVHIVDKSTTNMYDEMIGPNGNLVRNETALVSKQIILNYCFGHPNSTILLFPYSSHVSYINHHSTEFNAKLEWATDFSFFHREEWLNKSMEFLEDQWNAGLLLEFIATRDILPGEEILIDYGVEWQEAWDQHVKSWVPLTRETDMNNSTVWSQPSEKIIGKAGYIRAERLNEDDQTPIKTQEEQVTDPYPYNVEIRCYVNTGHYALYAFVPVTVPFFKRAWNETLDYTSETLVSCNVTQRFLQLRDNTDNTNGEDDVDEDEEDEESDNHKYSYTIEMDVKKVQDTFTIYESHVITNVPWKAIKFINKPYTSDVFLKNAFRHEMKIPDEIFPKAWMNLIPQEEKEEKD